MSLTLPNTYTEYVPLDILQAAQLNNDNENNQYIADQFPISASNIDLSSIRDVLYEDSDPRQGGIASGNITLSADINNYVEIGIYYRSAYDFCQNFTKARVVPSGNVTSVSLETNYNASDGAGNFKLAQLNISGNTATIAGSTEWPYASPAFTQGSKVYVTKIVGYKVAI